MTLELQALFGSVVLGLAHLVLVAQLSNYHRGYTRWAASARDQVAEPLPPVPARLERAYRNYLETFPYFAAAVLMAHITNVHGTLTEWGALLYLGARIAYVVLYAAGMGLARSIIWNVAFAGISLILVAIARAG